MSTTDFWVGDRIVRPSLGEIRLGLERMHVEPRSMEVLLALCRHAPEVVPKEELMQEVWGEAFVSEEVLPHAIWDLRRALGDDASNPEFIQTVPKRGYRVIAPINSIEPDDVRRRGTYRRAAAWGVAAAVLLVAGALWLGQRRPPAAPAKSGPPSIRPLVLTPTRVRAATELPATLALEAAGALDTRLQSYLVGSPGIELVLRGSCSDTDELGDAICLEPSVEPAAAAFVARARLSTVASGELAYATPPIDLQGAGEVPPVAAEIAELVRAYLEITQDPFAHDPDIQPWFDYARHDTRAIRDFLLAVDFVYRNEVGARDPLTAAWRRDPRFIAPLVWRTPTLLEEADAEELAAHRQALAGLYDDANSFEKPMLGWAIAAIDGETAVQIRQLRIALEQQPGNRPLMLMLAVAYMREGGHERSLRELEPLVEQRWYFPGLYNIASRCALHLRRIDDARRILAIEIEGRPVDPEVLVLRQLMAIYDGDGEGQQRHRNHLELRLREMAPEVIDFDATPYAEILAEAAEAAGREPTARRLREFDT